ncbi:hypothetical protein [Mesomycoplasma hyorhinis]|uniref:hypothetical protein n=1 Tax=Mesomycoplasma hyorhinis TaxID=2100 RepID=UPI001F2D04A8|nr:hypothetical protein [Mesomycoplasma hyorhinis]
MNFQSLIFLKAKALRNTIRFIWILWLLSIIVSVLFVTLSLPVVKEYISSLSRRDRYSLVTDDSMSYNSSSLFEAKFTSVFVFALAIGFVGLITAIVLTVRTISLKNLIYPLVMNSQNSSSSFMLYDAYTFMLYDAYRKINFASKMFIFMWIPFFGAFLTLFGILVLVSLFKASSAAKTLSMIQFSPQ